MAITPAFSKGIYALENCLKAEGKKRPLVKVQTTGPFSFALTIVDENKRAIYYNEEFRDMIVKALAMKCRWQIQKFQPYAENIICFIDEPILSAFGSCTYVSVQREDVVALLKEVIDAVHADGPGRHPLLRQHRVEHPDRRRRGHRQLRRLRLRRDHRHVRRVGQAAPAARRHAGLGRGADLASHPRADRRDPRRQVRAGADNLVAKAGIDKQIILEQAIITPSCGTGSIEVADGESVFQNLRAVSQSLRSKHGF